MNTRIVAIHPLAHPPTPLRLPRASWAFVVRTCAKRAVGLVALAYVAFLIRCRQARLDSQLDCWAACVAAGQRRRERALEQQICETVFLIGLAHIWRDRIRAGM